MRMGVLVSGQSLSGASVSGAFKNRTHPTNLVEVWYRGKSSISHSLKKDMNMILFKKVIKLLPILMVSLILIIFVLTLPTWPSKSNLCKDVESFLPKTECMRQENAVQIIRQAFPEGGVSSSDVKSALGKYLHAEYPTTYGHIEEYYLSVSPIDFLFRNFNSFRFGYNDLGILVAFSYDD